MVQPRRQQYQSTKIYMKSKSGTIVCERPTDSWKLPDLSNIKSVSFEEIKNEKILSFGFIDDMADNVNERVYPIPTPIRTGTKEFKGIIKRH